MNNLEAAEETKEDASADVLVGATDVEWTALGNSRFQLLAGPRRFVIEAEAEKAETLRHLVMEVVPKLRRTAAVREQLPAPELERLLPYAKRLADMGVLLHPREPIDSDAELRLYSFIARRSAAPDKVFASVRRPIALDCPPRLADALTGALRRQGLRPRDAGTADDRQLTAADVQAAGDARSAGDALTVVGAFADESALADATRELCRRGGPFLPVLVTPSRIRTGPWTLPGESACPHCTASYDLPATGTADATRLAHDSWTTLQSGCLEWAAGLIAHLVLRALMPMGADHPWGRVVTLDPATGGQSSARLWRDPYCAVCATPGPVAQEWREV
ncbi:hypothetical protein IPZ58_35260 [Streptomyces roseoverticillatus]|uniref:hypothetical protein n=1 Tax=Streptomyces roseoverticillatus TaxID=66429 RepID=UPI001F1AD4B8|nr:hypothetical protein [Streptomyces roseoverticillatus]MCF3106787.1 hypothetical protein [Streptomyces roseoverticillatus]